MKVLSNNAVDEIKTRINIADVVARYVNLKKVGGNFRGACPFHGEKTPSFYVTPSRQIWHCFGCSEGGDVFTFIQKIEHLDFRQALEMLAEQTGVELPSFDPRQAKLKSEQDLLYKINGFGAEFYHRVLFSPQGKSALEYIQKRGLKPETLEEWKIGFSPAEPQSLQKALAKHKITQRELVQAGIYAQGEGKYTYDRFKNRVTFPIFNLRGQVVGFSARIIDQSQFAKYVNSAESLVYKKSESLFGIFQAKDSIIKAKSVVVVEGQLDCISSHQMGLKNVVATSGTAFTEIHAKLVKRLASIVKLCFDADSAGQKALRKTAEILLRDSLDVQVVILPAGKDPDELIRKDPTAWQLAVTESVPVLDFYISNGQKLSSQNEKREWITSNILPFLKLITNPLDREYWSTKIASAFGFTLQAFEKMLVSGQPNFGSTESKHLSTQSRQLELQVIGGFMRDSSMVEEALSVGLTVEDFHGEDLRVLAGLCLSGNLLNLPQNALTEECAFVVESIHHSLGEDNASLKILLAKSCYRLRLNAVIASLQSVTLELSSLHGKEGLAKAQILQSKAQELAKLRVYLEQKI